jgi:hypothetical protein
MGTFCFQPVFILPTSCVWLCRDNFLKGNETRNKRLKKREELTFFDVKELAQEPGWQMAWVKS